MEQMPYIVSECAARPSSASAKPNPRAQTIRLLSTSAMDIAGTPTCAMTLVANAATCAIVLE
ncbi:MAG: hypothetical protein BWY59_00157 [Verrucomicrobia bacterium ADurb.Bin345]|nr:MAG: hypothetical protein BWY59_00157 [Verrucomicrobia bacterium ADurb.Bin345]